MSERILLNKTEVLNDLTLTLCKKYQKNSGYNYFFMPTISIQLYNPKVTWIGPYKKNMSFGFNKYENLGLLTLLKNIYNKLTSVYKKESETNVTPAPFFFEKGDIFYIKCYLPNINGKYSITSIFDNIDGKFAIPYLGSTYTSIIVDIRNIWEKDNHSGFNLELKETHTTVKYD